MGIGASPRNIGFGTLILVGGVFFILGVWVGEAHALSFEMAMSYNPLVYYQLMSKMQSSPYMWLTPDLWYSIRDAKSEFAIGTLSLCAASGAYWIVGPAGALKCLGVAAGRSRLAARALELVSEDSVSSEENVVINSGPRRRRDMIDNQSRGACVEVVRASNTI